ncbi:hypothetical protein TCAL_03438 [Tigriopus californicus]|uniref:Rhodanese domain-containing protein n=1 Tax=Tigriopus californicus TaxID=6832 RepID=A0A553NNV0_TIGCA|nr:hypothetical protein TCAL_03438 [Tigriopus californicus]|eukprot:TCALIF_03438-PA protein Name:"Similar to Hsp67Bb Heat shock protein 67B2 (Drosophila melanogaster)" AED:0.35 eAED:0.35 QI:274/1/1/1/1/1/4/91/121
MAPVKEFEFSSLKEALDKKEVTLVDVRNHSELKESGKIPGSFCIPLPELEHAFSMDEGTFESTYGFSKPNREVPSTLVITCRSGRRVQIALDQLEKLGYGQVGAYRGSFLDWEKNNGPIEH